MYCIVHFVCYSRTINAGKTYLVNEDQAFAEMFCLHVINIDKKPKEDTIVCIQPLEHSTNLHGLTIFIKVSRSTVFITLNKALQFMSFYFMQEKYTKCLLTIKKEIFSLRKYIAIHFKMYWIPQKLL